MEQRDLTVRDGAEVTRVVVDGPLAGAAAAAVRATLEAQGLSEERAERVRVATEELCREVAALCPDPASAMFEIAVGTRPGAVTVTVDDGDLPADLQDLGTGRGSLLDRLLRDGFGDELEVQSRGRDVSRATLVIRAPGFDVRTVVAPLEHREARAASAASPEEPIEVRFLEPEETLQLARCVYRCYGYTYDTAWVYRPDEVAARLRSGRLRSVVGLDLAGNVIGHVAARLDDAKARVAEAGIAVVDPRYRGHHLFTTLKQYLGRWAQTSGLYGVVSEATAAHPYTQEANLHLGAHEIGVLLGFIPAGVSYRGIKEDELGRRQSAVLMYLRTNHGPHRAVYPPAHHAPMLRRVYDALGLRRTVAEDDTGVPPRLGKRSRLDVTIRADHGSAELRVVSAGSDLVDVVMRRMRDFAAHGVAYVSVDLPLGNAVTQDLAPTLEQQGLFFAGVLPERHHGDLLRLQWLNGVPLDRGDVAVASDLGRELLAYVWAALPAGAIRPAA